MRARWRNERVEAFSDGVFAIAITLLVLEIHIEPEELAHPWRALADEWPAYLAYATSFTTVGGVWLAHHSLFSRLEAVDAVLIRLNLLLLMAVAFLPFPTGLMAQSLTASESAARAAVLVYGATALAIELLVAATVRYAAARPDLLAGGTALEARSAARRRGALSTALYGVALLIALLFLPKVAALAFQLVALQSVLNAPGERWERRRRALAG